jgi:dsRNA-specific ribonuclease
MHVCLTILSGEIDRYNPAKNSIGTLQDGARKEENPAHYQEISRTGPDHLPYFSVGVSIEDGRTFEGSGPSLLDARRHAAEMALKNI